MINSRHTGMIIWIIKILRRLHDTFYKQNVLSLAFRQRVGIILRSLKTQCLCEFASKTQYIKTKKALLTFTVGNAFFITLILFL